jgi:hypothetical protein
MSPQPGKKREWWRDSEPTRDEMRLERRLNGSWLDQWDRGDWWARTWLLIGPLFLAAFVVGLIVFALSST